MSTEARRAIELRGVALHQGGRSLLRSIDLTVEEGQACAVVGSNGSGKSALLRIVATLCRPTAGRVRVGGWDALAYPERVRPMIGYVPDEPGLAERLTPMEHLLMVAAQRGLGRADRRAAAESMLDLVDLVEQRQSPVEMLSRGQRRRLAIALALVHDPPIVLLDEPLAEVDEVGRSELISVLVELRAMGKTLLLASQAQSDIAEVADVVVPLVDGSLEPAAVRAATSFTWIEVLGDPIVAVRRLRERPGIDDVRHEGNFITFRGPAAPEQRAEVAEWLVAQGIHLSGLGTTGTPAGGDRS
ncbi:MAG: ABC transporter ATP-binding protein [Chloroflexi bacterium]|nr:ABC transporter ATP-binding protein [Chloroflexota bacterium]